MRVPRFVQDALLRRHARKMMSTAFDGDYTVSIARTVDEYEDAFRLVRIGYVYQGYLPMRSPELRIYDQHVLPESVVLVAKHRGDVVGTMTLTLDSPAGLPLDKDYPEELAELRRGGEKLVEYGALTVLRPHQKSGVTVLMNMAATWLSHNLLGAERVVIGINPKAIAWYRAAMTFSTFTAPRNHADLEAPVVGMTQDLEENRAFQRRCFRQPLSTGLMAHEHYYEKLPEQIEKPPVKTLEQLNRWKLPRDVFRALFVEHTHHLVDIDRPTREHLEQFRSARTLEVPTRRKSSVVRLQLEHTGPLRSIGSEKELRHASGC